jgi:hypothetical protein
MSEDNGTAFTFSVEKYFVQGILHPDNKIPYKTTFRITTAQKYSLLNH